MPERTCARICQTDVSCKLNVRKATSKSHLSDDVFDVWSEAGPDELDTEADVTLDVGQDVPDIFCTKSMQMATNQTSMLIVALLRTPMLQERLRQWRCSSSLSWISRAAMSKTHGRSSQSRQVH